MVARLVAGAASRRLAGAVAAALRTELTDCELQRFPDGELRPVVGEVRGSDVFLLQSTDPPANEHIVELLLLADACRRGGADRVSAVVPYFGYARQDRRARAGESLGARVVATALAAVGVDRLVVVDPHTASFEAMCPMSAETLTAVPALIGSLQRHERPEELVVVAPDLGAVKLAERYASLLGCRVAIVCKERLSASAVRAHELVGDVAGRPAAIVDDMISTGATIEAAVGVLSDHGVAEDITVVASHGPLAPGALERISSCGVRRVVLTDTVSAPRAAPAETCSVAPLLAAAIDRMHRDESLDDLSLLA